jgi:two-component system chemotaxis sensor kinase CheA
MDMAKYRIVFLEEATEHLGEISSALLDLEKEMSSSEAIDSIFRMAHSIKGMAASLEYDAITEISHKLEDRMQEIRSAGRVSGPEELALLFRGLEGLEKMVEAIREDRAVESDSELSQVLGSFVAPTESADATAKKKLRSPAP